MEYLSTTGARAELPPFKRQRGNGTFGQKAGLGPGVPIV
jgi:hypothetical protein